LLRQGKAKIAIAASDTHTPVSPENKLGTPQTVVNAGGLSRSGIMAGLQAGKMYLTSEKELTLLLTAHSGSATAGIGEQLPTSPGKKVQVRLAVKGHPTGNIVTLVGDKGIIAIKKAVGSKTELTWDVTSASSKYLRVELQTPE